MGSYLVTGGCGFIGSHIVEELLLRGANRVRVLDNLSSGYLCNIDQFRDRVEFVEADVRDFQALLSAHRGVDYVFHEQGQLRKFPQY